MIETSVGVDVRRTAFAAAARKNEALTAGIEKRLLVWMAERAPGWVTSDGLTVLGLAAQFGAGVSYAVARWHRGALVMAVVCIVLNWLGDSLDGTLARVRKQQRPRYGFYVDHMVDVVGSIALMCGMGASGFLHWGVAMAMLIAFLVLAAECYLAAHTLGQFALSQGMFGPTEIRILMCVGTLALLRNEWATVLGRRVLLFDIGGTIAAVAMAMLAIAVTLRHTAQLYREEPLP